MTSSSSVKKLPTWIFLLTDVVLIAAAALIAYESPKPLTLPLVFAIVACIFVGVFVGLVPLVIYYEREKNEMLDDRQRALEALARTVASSAEQISIAAGGLHEIADLAQKNLRQAEQLPHKLQEKIAEFQAQLANANDTEKEELEKELEELRASESERLQSVGDKIAKAAAEFAKVEAAANQHLAAANEAVGKLAFTAAGAIGKAQAAAEQAFAQARQEAAKSLGDATGQALRSIETAKAAATSDLAKDFDRHVERLKQVTAQLSTEIDKLAAAAVKPIHITPAAVPLEPTVATPAAPPPAMEATPTAAGGTETAVPSQEPLASPPKRPRKVRREEPVPSEPAAAPAAAPTETPAEPAPAAEPSQTGPSGPAPEPASTAEPAPIAPEKIAEIAPIAPHTAQPFSPEPASTEATETTPAPAETPKPPRKRAPKKTEEEQPALGLDVDETKSNGAENEGGGPGTVERVLTSDGATRLIVTAYIGIGNRLFIRGNGPGLSWDKGVPLQFVSIGKWRWETLEANAPVELKLLKNDEQESAGLGKLTIEPGHQHEVTANF